jgi:hypothetical protein
MCYNLSVRARKSRRRQRLRLGWRKAVDDGAAVERIGEGMTMTDKPDWKRRWLISSAIAFVCASAFAGGLARRGEPLARVVAAGCFVFCGSLAVTGTVFGARRLSK